VRSLDEYIAQERQGAGMSPTIHEVQEKTIEPMLIAGIRMKGRYDECGPSFGKLCRSFGRHCSGPPMMLYYDTEYKEIADFEVCVPVKQAKTVEGVSVREIPGGKCVSLIHQGPYDRDLFSKSYAKIMKYIKDKGYRISCVDCPSREIYLKGPGMIFKGNPKKYLTEIQFLVES
jgi:effector-binding domain-containing protein